jgi:hypothetical protein
VGRANRFDRILLALVGFAAFAMSMHIVRLGPINLTLSDLALVICLISLISAGKLNNFPFGQLTFLWCSGLGLMLGGLLVSSIVNGDPLRWLNVAAQYLFAWLLLPMVLCSFTERQMHKCMRLFVYGVAVSEAFGITASLLLPYTTSAALFGPGFVMGNGRLGALAGEGNWNGAVIAFAFPMLINCIQRKMIGVVPAILCVALLLWGLVACASFTGFGAAALAIALTIGIVSPRSLITIGAPLAGLAFAYLIAGLPLPGIFQERVAGALTTGDLSHAGTFEGRAMLIEEAWKLSRHTIFLGFGVDRYRDVSSFGAPVHQFLLLILTEGGAVALAGLLIMLMLLWVLAAKAITVDRRDGAAAVAVLAVFCIFTSAVPHMYTRLWIGPVNLVLASVALRQSGAPAAPTMPAMPQPGRHVAVPRQRSARAKSEQLA